MSHEFKSGFFVREPAWHELGVVLADYPGREEAMRLAGHDFTVVEHPVRVELLTGGMGTIPGWKALLKDGAANDGSVVLNIVKDSYQIVQNSVLWDVVDAIIDQPDVKYETAGVLREGAVLWVLARVDRPSRIPGDETDIFPFVCATTTHDGTGALKAMATSVRVVCMNTWTAAAGQASETGREFTFRHSGKVNERIAEAKDALAGTLKTHQAFIDMATELAGQRVSTKGRQLFLERFIPSPPAELITDRVAENIDVARAAVVAILGGKTTAEAHRHTAFGLFQAGVEYLDHIRPARSKDSMFGRSILSQDAAKSKVVRLAREAALVG